MKCNAEIKIVMRHAARQFPSWLSFDVGQAMRGIAKRGVEGEKQGESSLRVIRFSAFTLVGESEAVFRVGVRGLGVVRILGRTVFPPMGRWLEPVGEALVGDRAP